MANFATGRMVGMPLYLSRVQSTGFTYREYPQGVRRFPSNCRSIPISTYVSKRQIDFGPQSKAAVLVRPLLRSLPIDAVVLY